MNTHTAGQPHTAAPNTTVKAHDQPTDLQREPLAVLLPLLERFEGLRLGPYLCPAGVPTIGLGSTRYPGGQPVRLTDAPITAAQARALAQKQVLREYLPAVLQLCPAARTPGRIAALTDFAYNLGAGALRASTLRRKVNAGRWDQVPAELAKWVRAGARVLPGLVARRAAEALLI